MSDDNPAARFDLHFFVYGDKPIPRNLRPVTILPSDKIRDLAVAIREVYRVDESVTITGLSLFKMERSVAELSALELPDESEALIPFFLVSDVWPDASTIDRKLVHVLVKVGYRSGPRVTPGNSLAEPLTGLVADFARLAIARDPKKRRSRWKSLSVSAVATPSTFKKEQARGDAVIYNGRPWKNTGLPVELYHRVFRTFLDRVEKFDELPSSSDYGAVTSILLGAQDMYDDEKARVARLSKDLPLILGRELVVEKVQKCEADGLIKAQACGNGISPIAAILEAKNEIGTGGCDPSVQGAVSYLYIWNQDKMDKIWEASCCPSFIIAIAGPWMCILGAVYAEHVVVQPLTDILWLAHHPQKEDRLVRITRVFCALRASLRDLDDYYANLPLVKNSGVHFPDIQDFPGPGDSKVEFTYLGSLGHHNDHSRPVYVAKVKNTGTLIVVKFVQRYNTEAHRLVAAEGLAPKLLSDSAESESVGGGVRMIVMEYVRGVDFHEYTPKQVEQRVTELQLIRNDVGCALQLLHDRDLVFGDLRSPNVRVLKKEGKLGAMLLDFDWCDRHEEGRYPADINDELNWAEGVEKGGIMCKQHDVAMADMLFID